MKALNINLKMEHYTAKNVSANITEIVKNVEKINIMRALGCDEKYINGQASGFEWFDEWERILPLAEGHREAERYANELVRFCISVPQTEHSRERSIYRWRQANKDSFFEFYEDRNTVKPNENKESCEKEDCQYLLYDLKNSVSKSTEKCRDIKALTAELFKEIKNITNPYITLNLDISGYEYLRPDPYLSEVCYSKLIRDEKLNKKESMAMYAQILIELLILMKNEKRVSLYFETDGDLSHACALARYLNERRIFEGRIWISVTVESDMDELTKLLTCAYPHIRVTPVIDISDKTVSDDNLKNLFYRYPKGAFLLKK